MRGLVPADGTYTVSWIALGEGAPKPTWDVTCGQALDGCRILNDPDYDKTYGSYSIAGSAFYFEPGDDIIFSAKKSSGSVNAEFRTQGDPPVTGSGNPARVVIAVGLPTVYSNLVWTTVPETPVAWTVSRARDIASVCEPGAEIPPGYKLTEGDSGNNTIAGGSGKDLIRGLDGNDRISDLSGDDILCGNAGNDTLSGNGGNDTLIGGTGTDTLNGGSGLDAGCDEDNDTVSISIEKACSDGASYFPADI